METAYYPADKILVALNNAEEAADCTIQTPDGAMKVHLEGMETKMIQL